MSALDNFSPAAVSVVKVFAYSFHAAPTADIVVWGVDIYGAGGTPASLLDTLYNLAVPQSPFTAYARSSSNTAFVTALVDNFTYGTSISAATKAGWVTELLPTLAGYASRGQFAIDISTLVDNYAGTNPDLQTLKGALTTRAEAAAAFAQSPSGSLYNGLGWAQLNAPLTPAATPTYDLSADVNSANEGTNVVFTLHTTHVAAGTQIDYNFSGLGISAGDLINGTLTGTLTVNASGTATVLVTLLSDATTEGVETLRMQLANNLAHADVLINDTSLTPVPQPNYVLSANVAAQDEGASITYVLTTTNVPAGTLVNYTLSGTGITAADIAGGTLSGTFITNAQGVATVNVALVADALTEGAETLRLQLASGLGQLDVTIKDTSLTPPPTGSPDVVLIADAMNSANAHAPGSPAEGEIPFNTYLNYDLLNQSGADDVRMSIAALKATNPTAGAPPDNTNQSADRASIPQVSNQSLYTFDLGLQIDRVDYSAETGKIVAVVSTETAADTQWVLVNDNGTDNIFSNSTDRIDILKNVEEVVASAGGGMLDLTNSDQDWQITFSRNFNPSTDISASDRALHRIELSNPTTGTPYGRSYYEVRDGGTSAGVTQVTAAWSSIQGSDHNETLSYTGYESLDARNNVLRGGTNTLKFNELTRSILVDVSLTPWVASTNPVDDTNSSGRIVATTTFTNGDGVTPLSGNTNVTSSHTPDNNVAAGMLIIAASQDAEDAVSFSSSPLPKIFVIGQTVNGSDYVSVRLAGSNTAEALRLSGFEFLRDNGASDDLYIADNIFKATQGSPKLSDGAGNDHDAIRIGNEALGSSAVGGAVGAVNLGVLTGPVPGFNVDFDVLDLSILDTANLLVTGTAGTDDEVVLGKLATVSAVTLFESVVLTNASTDKGSALTLDLDAGAVKAGATTLFTYGGSVISAGGLAFNSAGQASVVAPMTVSMNITVVDTTAGAGATLWGGSAADLFVGGAGNDTLRGGGGNDTLNGGAPAGGGSFAETWTFTLGGTPDGTPDAAHRVTIAMTIDGKALTLSEAAAADTDYSDGIGAVVDGATSATIGTAMAGLINANLASINAGPGTGTLTGASYVSGSNQVVLTFLAGVDANDVVTFVLNSGAGPDAGSFTLSSGVNVNGGSGGNDTYVFEKTGALNGTDTIVNFTPASDKLDVRAFAGAPISAASSSIDGAAGGILAGVPTTAEFIYNKTQGSLSPNDFATSVTPGKLVLADGGRSVIAVTLDPTGAKGDPANTPVTLYFVENGPAAGLNDLSISLVGIISGPVELTMADIYTALT